MGLPLRTKQGSLFEALIQSYTGCYEALIQSYRQSVRTSGNMISPDLNCICGVIPNIWPLSFSARNLRSPRERPAPRNTCSETKLSLLCIQGTGGGKALSRTCSFLLKRTSPYIPQHPLLGGTWLSRNFN